MKDRRGGRSSQFPVFVGKKRRRRGKRRAEKRCQGRCDMLQNVIRPRRAEREGEMSHRDLREFVARLEEEGELHRVAVEVDPVLEIAEITNRMSKSPGGGKALLFERVRGSDIPVAT